MVSGVLNQVVGRHVEDPDAAAIAEGNVRDIVGGLLVHVIHRAPHRAKQGYRAGAIPKHRHGVRDGVAVGVAHAELHRHCAALLHYAAAVCVDWLQNSGR